MDRVDVYDPVADSWQQMAAMPTARHSHSAAVLDGKIYVSGGSNCPNSLEAYDPVADTWTTLANLSAGRVFHTSAAVSSKLCVIGGWSPYAHWHEPGGDLLSCFKQLGTRSGSALRHRHS